MQLKFSLDKDVKDFLLENLKIQQKSEESRLQMEAASPNAHFKITNYHFMPFTAYQQPQRNESRAKAFELSFYSPKST